ncbi:MAG TPA: tol-pal system protein YbgF [Halomonas sp.]|nr:tol-pal system protein YbgF [Halomonas sp.]
MRQRAKRLLAVGALGAPFVLAGNLFAQQLRVDDLTDTASSFYERAATREEAGGSLALFNEVQSNQETIRQLRGQVEELRYQLDQLRKQSRQQYMDLDARLGAIESSGGDSSAGPAPASESVSETAGEAAREASSRPEQTPATSSAAAKEAYQSAFAKVQEREFDAAISAFERFVADYPDAGLAANGHYWLGELYAAKSELDRADQSFQRVIDAYPQSSKVPDAIYKLGLLKARQGEPDASRELLDRVRDEYPDSTAAGLAEDFVRQSGQ